MKSGSFDIRAVEEGTIGGRLPGKPKAIEERPLYPLPKFPPHLVLQSQFKLMMGETTLIMTTFGARLVPPTPVRPCQDVVHR